MDAKLVVVGENVKPAEIKLNLPVTIGRGRKATLILPHPMISRRHCEIFEANGYLVVRDLGSMNGTYINNRRITEAVLAPGELLSLGTITFRAVYEVAHDLGHRKTELGAPSPAVNPPLAAARGGEASDSEDRRLTQGATGFPSGSGGGEDASTEVSDVDPEELLERFREAEQRRAEDS